MADNSIELKLPPIPLWVSTARTRVINKTIRDTLVLALTDAAGYISDEANRYSDTGALAQSFGSFPATTTGGIELFGARAGRLGAIRGRVFSSLPYAVVVDQGRRAGSPISREGVDAIGLWAQRKLGLSADDASSAKFAIARAIVKRGLEGKDFFAKGVERSKGRRDQLFTILGQQIATALVKTGGGNEGAS